MAVGTPYDPEFVPFLRYWVEAARKNGLKVWFRGNFSGWEGWFDYEKIDRSQHQEKIIEFIKSNKNLFEDGDVFVSCPECENGGPGDPRLNGDVEGFRNFLIDEHNAVVKQFDKLGLKIITNYYSMNGDVAKLIMDRDTTKSLGGIVTIDHYVETPQMLTSYIKEITESSGGKVVIGEFGAPINDINGTMTESQQAEWVHDALKELIKNPNVVGVNYWVNIGGSTELWNLDGTPRSSVNIVKNYYSPKIVFGTIKDDAGMKLRQVNISSSYRQINTTGLYSLPIYDDNQIKFEKEGYTIVTQTIDSDNFTGKKEINITLYPKNPSFFYKAMKKVRQIIAFFKKWVP